MHAIKRARDEARAHLLVFVRDKTADEGGVADEKPELCIQLWLVA
jgi:hypothetical protein